jgi:hypothetical protein
MEETTPQVKLCPNFIVFQWSPNTHEHTLVKDDPEANIVEINKYIDELNENCYYAVFQKDYKGDEYGIVAMIVSKGATAITKMLGYSAPRTAKKMEDGWWFR